MQEKPYANRNCEINKQQNENSSEKEENKKKDNGYTYRSKTN